MLVHQPPDFLERKVLDVVKTQAHAIARLQRAQRRIQRLRERIDVAPALRVGRVISRRNLVHDSGRQRFIALRPARTIYVALRDHRAQPRFQRAAAVEVRQQRPPFPAALLEPVQFRVERVRQFARAPFVASQSPRRIVEQRPVVLDEIFPGRRRSHPACAREREVLCVEPAQVIFNLARRGWRRKLRAPCAHALAQRPHKIGLRQPPARRAAALVGLEHRPLVPAAEVVRWLHFCRTEIKPSPVYCFQHPPTHPQRFPARRTQASSALRASTRKPYSLCQKLRLLLGIHLTTSITRDPHPSRAPNSPTAGRARDDADNRLDSWKEIAAYLRRDVRTVQRWEKHERLPVHRRIHHKLATIYAYRTELDAWWQSNDSAAHSPPQADTSGPRAPLLAVVPLRNLSGDPEQDYFSDGLTEELIAQLSRVNPDQLGVIARGSALKYRNSNKGVDQIGRELGANYILDGSVRRSNQRVRISVQLIAARDQVHLWTESYDRDLHDILELQSEVAEAAANHIAITISKKERARLANTAAVNPAAYEAYLRGRFFWNRRSEDGLRRAVQLFEQAVASDLNYAPAHAGLADCYA